MKSLICIVLLVSGLFAGSLSSKLEKCMDVKLDNLRLQCYDSIAKEIDLDDEFKLKAQTLVSSCTNCHGVKWDISTNGERLVKDMSKKEILDSLKAYKTGELSSIVMNFHMNKYSVEEIEMMAKYISHQVLLED